MLRPTGASALHFGSTLYYFAYGYSDRGAKIPVSVISIPSASSEFGLNIRELDLSSWDTSSVTNMRGTFFNCSSLTTIYASPSFVTTAVTWDRYMFSGCSSLVGGAGTSYTIDRVDWGGYARIDGGPSAPGFFTARP